MPNSIFFPSIPDMTELLSASRTDKPITSKNLERIAGTPPPSADKTLQKFFKNPGSVTAKTRDRLIGYLESVPESESLPKTVAFVKYLIEEENELTIQVSNESDPLAKLELLFYHPFSQCISKETKDIPVKIIASLDGQPSDNWAKSLNVNPDFNKFMTNAIVSLFMRILAHGEHEWKQRLVDTRHANLEESYISKLLPILGKKNQIESPIRRFFWRLRNIAGFRSWAEMAGSIPHDCDRIVDIEDQRRELNRWRSGQVYASTHRIYDWLKNLTPSETERYTVYFRHNLYQVAVFLNRLLDVVQESTQLTHDPSFVVASFGSFHRHLAEFEEGL